MIEVVLLTAFAAVVLAGAVYDAATLTIPNWISLFLVGLFPVLALTAGLAWSEVGLHLAVGIMALLLGMGLFAANIVGGGDAKLFAAIALYMGLGWVGSYVFTVALAGGCLAVALIALRAVAASPLGVFLVPYVRLPKSGIPYGIAIAAGGLFVFPTTHFFLLATSGV